MSKFLLFAGTRPEIIKLRPVYDALVAQGDEPIWAIASQSPDLIPLAFGDYDERIIRVPFSVENYRHPLVGLHIELTRAISYNVPFDIDWKAVVVHGDTQTAASAAMVCALAGLPVAHVEAGLRSHSHFPWPEEQNRRLIASLASLHLAPTNTAWSNLVAEGVHRERVIVTGQTGIDALHAAQRRVKDVELPTDSCPRIVVTCHRRENKDRISLLASAFKPLLADHHILWPAHPNYGDAVCVTFPFVQPMTHDDLVSQLEIADLVITDSGGIIEEAAELEKPCLIIRDETERPEALDDGCCLVKRDEMSDLRRLIAKKLAWNHTWKRSSKGLYGDGKAAERVAAALRQILP